jgi:flagellar hook-associated protein 3 FlgL
MRVASSHFESTITYTMQNSEARLAKLVQQISSGLRVPLPSDDPVASVRLSRLLREEAMVSQYRDNIGALKIRLQKNEGYLSSMTSDMNQARDLLVWALDASSTPSDLNAMVGSLRSLKESLFFTANSKDQEGRYIFSGTTTNVAPIAEGASSLPVGTRYSFKGNTQKQQVAVGNNMTMSANVDISGIEELLNKLDQAIELLSAPGINMSVNNPLGAPGTTRDMVAATLDSIDVAMDSVGIKTASLGGAQNILSTLGANHSNISLSNQTALIDIGRLDYAKAAAEISSFTAAIESTQKAYAKVSQLSLFDML